MAVFHRARLEQAKLAECVILLLDDVALGDAVHRDGDLRERNAVRVDAVEYFLDGSRNDAFGFGDQLRQILVVELGGPGKAPSQNQGG